MANTENTYTKITCAYGTTNAITNGLSLLEPYELIIDTETNQLKFKNELNQLVTIDGTVTITDIGGDI